MIFDKCNWPGGVDLTPILFCAAGLAGRNGEKTNGKQTKGTIEKIKGENAEQSERIFPGMYRRCPCFTAVCYHHHHSAFVS